MKHSAANYRYGVCDCSKCRQLRDEKADKEAKVIQDLVDKGYRDFKDIPPGDYVIAVEAYYGSDYVPDETDEDEDELNLKVVSDAKQAVRLQNEREELFKICEEDRKDMCVIHYCLELGHAPDSLVPFGYTDLRDLGTKTDYKGYNHYGDPRYVQEDFEERVSDRKGTIQYSIDYLRSISFGPQDYIREKTALVDNSIKSLLGPDSVAALAFRDLIHEGCTQEEFALEYFFECNQREKE